MTIIPAGTRKLDAFVFTRWNDWALDCYPGPRPGIHFFNWLAHRKEEGMLEKNNAYKAAENLRFFLESYFKERTAHPEKPLWTQASETFSKAMEHSNRIFNRLHPTHPGQAGEGAGAPSAHFTEHASDSAAVSSGSASSAKAPSNLSESISAALQAVQQEYPMPAVTILKIIPHDMSQLPIPRESFENLVFNLISNARRALGERAGIIAIETAEKIFTPHENTRVRRFVLRISDTGPVFSPEELDHLFDSEPGKAADTRNTDFARLAAVKKIADQYSGSLRVETSLKGTSFFIEFPQ